MNYKPGDKVKIKTWEVMRRMYTLNNDQYVNIFRYFHKGMEEELNEKIPDRILTIRITYRKKYSMTEMGYDWTDDMIECLESEYIPPIPDTIHSRYEILDLREL